MRGSNLKLGQPDGDRGRRAGGRERTRRYNNAPIDDSGRTFSQYWGFLAHVRLVDEHGQAGAHAILSARGQAAWAQEMADFNRYISDMRELAQKGENRHAPQDR